MQEQKSTCVILRTNRFGQREQDFLTRLRQESGYEVAIAADETRGEIDSAGFPKISVTPARARRIGLYCPKDFGWRCGDYSLYLARQSMPHIQHFWIIEPDVRLAAENYGAMFRLFDGHPEIDLISPGLRPSGTDHLWHPTMRQRTRDVYLCSFPLARFSARALDICLQERRRDYNNFWARLMWPNDESFTSTVIVAAGLTIRDANDFGRQLYTGETFGFFTVRKGEEFDAAPPTGLLYHPVLWGADYERKMNKAFRGVPLHEVIRLKLLRGLMVKRYQRLLGLDRIVAPMRPVASRA